MIWLTHLDQLQTRPNCAFALGVFDGVHLGHQQLLKAVVASSQAHGWPSVVMTFFPHPRLVISAPQEERYYLQRLEERVAEIGRLGVDIIITQPFDEQLRRDSAPDFVARLHRALALRQWWGGEFSIGYQREGNAHWLQEAGLQYGFTLHQHPFTATSAMRVSSSRVRSSLAQGDMADVWHCLGRPYRVTGPVLQGRKLGRTIGWPTANVGVWDEQLLPPHGAYATWVQVGEDRYQAATNIGVRPTVNGHGLTVEAHLLNFSGDLYGKTIEVAFVQQLRPEQKFSSLAELQAQIGRDIATTRQLLALQKEGKHHLTLEKRE